MKTLLDPIHSVYNLIEVFKDVGAIILTPLHCILSIKTSDLMESYFRIATFSDFFIKEANFDYNVVDNI